MAPASPPTLDELRRLAPVLQSITAAHGGLGLQVFGLVVHGPARPGSDLDLLVEFPASPSFEQVMDLKLALEDLLSVPVDLVPYVESDDHLFLKTIIPSRRARRHYTPDPSVEENDA